MPKCNHLLVLLCDRLWPVLHQSFPRHPTQTRGVWFVQKKNEPRVQKKKPSSQWKDTQRRCHALQPLLSVRQSIIVLPKSISQQCPQRARLPCHMQQQFLQWQISFVNHPAKTRHVSEVQSPYSKQHGDSHKRPRLYKKRANVAIPLASSYTGIANNH